MFYSRLLFEVYPTTSFHLLTRLYYFLQLDNSLTVHFVGAFLAFVLGAVYAWLQVYLSYKLLNQHCTKAMFALRAVGSATTTIGLINSILFIRIISHQR